jgi:hypothetical protein
MTRTKIIPWFGGTAFLLVLLAWPAGASSAESGSFDNIGRVLQASALLQAERAEVQTRAAAAISAGVPAEDVEIIISRSLNRGADAGAINRFLATSGSTKKEGLPVGPVLDRIEQGLSKGVAIERIAAAAERLAEKLVAARPLIEALIQGGMTPRRSAEQEGAIAATARAMEKALPVEAIEGIGAAVRGKGGSLSLFTSAVDTASYFVANGTLPQTASRLVRNAVEKGYSEHDLDGMVKHLDAEMRRGARAEDAASRMEREGLHGERRMERQDMLQDMNSDRGRGAGPGMGGRGR